MIVIVIEASGQLGQKVLKALLNKRTLPQEPGC